MTVYLGVPAIRPVVGSKGSRTRQPVKKCRLTYEMFTTNIFVLHARHSATPYRC